MSKDLSQSTLVTIALSLTPLIALAIWMLWLNDGMFVYALDDAYIHLSVAEQILSGNYGINAAEFAAPSSSILWPFLLVPFEAIGLGEYGPFIINLSCYVLLAALLNQYLRGLHQSVKPFLILLFLIFTNMPGLVFAGMEHGLQVLLAVFIVSEILSIDRKPISRFLPFALFIAPLIRYELLALSGASIVWLLWYKQYRFLWVGFASALSLAVFSWVLYHHTGHWMPSSVLMKLDDQTVHQAHDFDITRINILVLLMITLIASYVSDHKHRVMLVLFVSAFGLAHLLFGKFGWFGRYEAYLIAALLFILIDRALHCRFDLSPRHIFAAVASVLLLTYHYAQCSISSATASHSIYAQQVQMRYLHNAIGNPTIAANDIGYLSYHNSGHVIDTLGLSNVESHIAMQKDRQRFLGGLAKQGAKVAMLYPHWFAPHVMPSSWQKVAELHYRKPYQNLIEVLGGDHVDIYVIDAAYADRLREAPQTLSLPDSAKWVLHAP